MLSSVIAFLPSRSVALAIGPLAIHWYGIMYLLAFVLAWWLVPRLQKLRGLDLTPAQCESLFTLGILGVLIGGRAGYVLFYGLDFYLRNPMEILQVWKGGMSSHGGFLGVTLVLLFFSKRQKVDVFAIADVLVVPVAIGLALGRLGNFVNLELYGTATTLPWGIAIPGVEGLRHPTQIYAIIKDLFIAGMCYVHLTKMSVISDQWSVSGLTSALFLMLYGSLRFLVEFFREQPFGYFSFEIFSLSIGQLLTIPIFIAGVCLFLIRMRTRTILP